MQNHFFSWDLSFFLRTEGFLVIPEYNIASYTSYTVSLTFSRNPFGAWGYSPPNIKYFFNTFYDFFSSKFVRNKMFFWYKTFLQSLLHPTITFNNTTKVQIRNTLLLLSCEKLQSQGKGRGYCPRAIRFSQVDLLFVQFMLVQPNLT